MIYSSRTLLDALWNEYKKEYFDSNGRTVDRQKANITTSEGQSYTMLRAVWSDDQPAFQLAWQWTQQNLQRPDHLFSWLYGAHPDGTYGVLTEQNGQNTATDADTDLAVALLFAYDRWREPQYLNAANDIVQGIWQHEVVTINGTPIIVSNNIEQYSPNKVLVNPSYFAPYAYRMFAQLDPTHDWNALVDSSYRLISQSSQARLDTNSSAILPPDWITVDRQNGAVGPATTPGLTSDYGYEAARLPWRLALDWYWYKDPRAVDALAQFSYLQNEWQKNGKLFATYGHNGTVVGDYEIPMMYGGSLGYFLVSDPSAARTVYEQKLLSLYDPGALAWHTQLSYYDSNWAWFGLALYHNALINLSPFSTAARTGEYLSALP